MRFHALTAGFFPIHVLGHIVRFDAIKAGGQRRAFFRLRRHRLPSARRGPEARSDVLGLLVVKPSLPTRVRAFRIPCREAS